jgi:chromosomal replication initiator protein
MTCTPRVWREVLRRLQETLPDFAFDAWIAPLEVKIAEHEVLLGCPTSFHRDRVVRQYADRITRCLAESLGHAHTPTIRVLCAREFAEATGHVIEITLPASTAKANKVETAQRIQATIGHPALTGPTAPPSDARVRVLPIPARGGSEGASTDGPAMEPGTPLRQSTATPFPTPTPRSAATAEQTELPFSFESFVVGPCNALAREAALALARNRQPSLSQLFLGSASGMGKTHLARAAVAEARRHGSANAASRRRAPRGVVYTSAEQFTSEFVSAMRNGRADEFKKRYRAPIDLLVVEDVQFFSGRAKTQLELFHTAQHVIDAGGRVLWTGDRPPRELGGLDDRMRAQMSGGFVAELEPPDALVRRHILRSKAAAGGVRLPTDCLDLLVESTGGSVRDLESVLIQVVTTASLLGRAIDLDLTREAIDLKSAASARRAPRTIAVSEIVRIVAAFFGKRPEALASRSRRRDVLVPRQLAMYLAHRYTDASLAEIGRALGRDHPSVRNAIGRIERQVLENAPLRYQVEGLSERIDQNLRQESAGEGNDPGH